MTRIARWAGAVSALFTSIAFVATTSAPAAAQTDLSGKWELDLEKSEDMEQKILAGVGATGKFPTPRARMVTDRLLQFAKASGELEIEQTAKDFKVFDMDDNVTIYYLDGKKHMRQTPWGAKLQTLASWADDQVVAETDGKDLGKLREVFTLDGSQLALVIQMENKEFAETIIVRHYYNRVE